MRSLPDAQSHSTYVQRVRFRDTDMMGIVHHTVYLEYFEAARIEYLRRRGSEYLDWTRRGVHLAVAETRVRYHKPAVCGERLAVDAMLVDLAAATARFEYQIRRDDSGRELVAEGSTLLVCVGDNRRPKRVPTDLAALLCGPETHPRPYDQA